MSKLSKYVSSIGSKLDSDDILTKKKAQMAVSAAGATLVVLLGLGLMELVDPGYIARVYMESSLVERIETAVFSFAMPYTAFNYELANR